MSAREENLRSIEHVAQHLGDLKERIVFVGGSTVSLFITSPLVHEVRATKDVDLVVEVASTVEYYQVADLLRAKGFQEDTREDAPMCRWLISGVTVDVVPARAGVFGPTNRWYASAMDRATTQGIGQESIKVIHPIDFIATKLEALAGRGKGDYTLSHDLEDIVTVIDGRAEIVNELAVHVDMDVRHFISSTLSKLELRRRLAILSGAAD